MTTRGSRFFIALLVVSAWFALPASGRCQSSDQTANQSTIFPSLTSKSNKQTVIWPEADVKQTSPTHKTVFEQTESVSAQPGASESAAEPSQLSLPNNESCPECGRPLDHPILGSCDRCGPIRRLLCLISPGRIFAADSGSPVYHEPWINRPFSVGMFVGPMVGSPLINNWIGQQTGTLGGMRFGWDMDDDYGIEFRLATANIPTYDCDPAYEAQLGSSGGLSIPYLAGTRNADHFIFDIDFLYYPWGDAHCRPYLLFGIGTDRIKFTDRMGTNYARILLGMPVGLGVKMHLNDWLVFRVEATENMAFAGGSIFQAQQNFSLTGALEVRLGRTRIQYWPWNPGK